MTKTKDSKLSNNKQITKSDFLTYCVCPKDFWLRKNRQDIYKKPELTLHFQKLIRDGYEVEKYAKQLFDDAVFQKQVESAEIPNSNGVKFYAEFDMFRIDNETGKALIYEVKSSSEIKTDLAHNHIKDITFQTIVAEKAGIQVGGSFIVHVNRDYAREGDINPFELLKVVDVTEKVQKEKEQVGLMMDESLKLMLKENVDITKCDCLYRSAGQRCDSFSVLNKNVPKYSIQQIFQGKKIKELVEQNILDPKDVPDDFDMTEIQRDKVTLQKLGKPIIDCEEIFEILNKMIYPIYFFDYESINKPVPILDGYNPNQHLVFQYSLHKLKEDGSLEHFEYLADDYENSTLGLVEHLAKDLGPTGTVLVWHETFEKGRNKELMKLHPEFKNIFVSLNERIYDLKKVFQKHYLHPEFMGSASIKKVMPVILPKLSYKDLQIQDGTMAMSEWERMISIDDAGERKELRKNLLKYCELDTYAMVELYRFLKDYCDKNI